MTRKYELKERARRKNETRRRIVEATVALHSTEGPARTTISAIAERAGVERHTVYAHFPDERSLFESCSSHWREEHPFPEGATWAAESDPVRRLRVALDEVYRWYEIAGADLAVIERDAESHGLTGELVRRRRDHVASIADSVADAWPRRRLVRAAVAHAFELETWRSLAERQRLSRREAVEAMSAFVAGV